MPCYARKSIGMDAEFHWAPAFIFVSIRNQGQDFSLDLIKQTSVLSVCTVVVQHVMENLCSGLSLLGLLGPEGDMSGSQYAWIFVVWLGMQTTQFFPGYRLSTCHLDRQMELKIFPSFWTSLLLIDWAKISPTTAPFKWVEWYHA